MIQTVKLLKHQYQFIQDTKHKFLALIGGFGSGKTIALVHKAIQLAYLNKGTTGLLLEPNYPLLHDILIPVLEAELTRLNIPYETRKTPNYNLYIYFSNKPTLILLRSFENWERLIGVNASFIGVDEIDTVKKETAAKAWQKLQGRLRAGNVRQMFTTSTPEGFGFLYDWFYKNQHKSDRAIIKAKTTDNPYLPRDYIDSLFANYPENLIEAYINGEFVNLASGTVYRMFDRFKNDTSVTYNADEALHIGMDFNIEKMAAVVHIIRDNKFYAVDEIVDVYDTFEMVEEIKRRYQKTRNRIIIYPDASGNQRKTSAASMTDIKILKKEGFEVVVNARNPSVKDRITAMNAAFCNMQGERSYFVNTQKCPRYTEALEQLAYSNGQPDKSSGYDHITDAAGYFIVKMFKPKSVEIQKIRQRTVDRYIEAMELEGLHTQDNLIV